MQVSFASDGTVLGRYGHDARCETATAAAAGGAGDEGDRSPQKKKRKRRSNKGNFLIPRQRLRQELLDLLEPGTVEWGCNFESYEAPGLSTAETDSPERDISRTPGAGVLVRFSPRAMGEAASVVNAAVLVGADGIFSRVGKQRMAAEATGLVYTGVLVVLGICDYSSVDELASHELLANGTTIAETVDGSTRIYMMPFSPTQQMWQLSVPMELTRAEELRKSGTEALRQEALRLCGDWHAPLPALLHATLPENVTGYPVFDRDPLPPTALRPVREDGRRFEADRLVTLLGDAIHPMAPFKGQGANQALLDGVLLSDELKKSMLGRSTAHAISGRSYGAAPEAAPPVSNHAIPTTFLGVISA